MNDHDKSWHLDRRIPIALMTAITIQTSAAIWWAATISARVDQLERNVIITANQSDRIVRVETKIEGIAAAIDEIKKYLWNKLP